MEKKSLPAAEMDVLACLSRLGRATAAELCSETESYRPMAHGSMVTLLKRLEAKALVTREKAPAGKAFIYAPSRGKRAPFRTLVNNLVQRVFHGDGSALVASLFENRPPNAEELERIQKLVDDLRRQQAKDSKK